MRGSIEETLVPSQKEVTRRPDDYDGDFDDDCDGHGGDTSSLIDGSNSSTWSGHADGDDDGADDSHKWRDGWFSDARKSVSLTWLCFLHQLPSVTIDQAHLKVWIETCHELLIFESSLLLKDYIELMNVP